MTTNIKPDEEPFGPFTVAEVENCFKAFDLDSNGFVGAGELRKYVTSSLQFLLSLSPIPSVTECINISAKMQRTKTLMK